MENNRHLTQSTIEAIEKLDRIEAEERAILNGSESVELNDGKLLNKEEQLAFFEQVYKLAVLNGACNQVQKFKHLYETEDFYGAWSVLFGNIDWLSNKNILHKEKHWLPKSVSIGTTYHDNGQVWEKCQYKDDKRDGEYVSYYDDGQVLVKCQYKDDKIDGEYVGYYNDGQVWEKCQCKDDKIDGEYVSYYDDGQVCVECQYKDGKLLD